MPDIATTPFELANAILDAILLIIVPSSAIYLIFNKNKGSFNSNIGGAFKNILLKLQSVLLASGIVAFWFLPILVIDQAPIIDLIHWSEFFGGLSIILFFKKPTTPRRMAFFITLLIILLIGWWVNEGLGLMFFSLPLICIFFIVANQAALAVIPSTDPFSSSERSKRRLFFIGYALGMQSSAWNISSPSQRAAERRIEGTASPLRIPELVRLDSHHVIGIINDNKLRVGGPGTIFTKPGDSLLEIVDLRNQRRESLIQVFSREGIPFEVKIDMEFCIDRLDLNLKVQKAIRWKSNRIKPERKIERWDDHVITEVNATVSNVLVNRGIDELWLAEQQSQGAAEEIEAQIRNQLDNKLKLNGVRLLSVQLSEFNFAVSVSPASRELDVSAQQITSWNLEKEREIKMEQAEFIAKGRIIEEQARQHARSTLLAAILKGVEDAKSHHPEQNNTKFLQAYLEVLKTMIDQHLDANERSDAKDELWKSYEEFRKRENKNDDVEK